MKIKYKYVQLNDLNQDTLIKLKSLTIRGDSIFKQQLKLVESKNFANDKLKLIAVIALINNEMVAWTCTRVMLYKYNKLHFKKNATVGIFVKNKFRKKGIGIKLLYKTINVIKNNYPINKLTANTHNVGGKRLFLACGFNLVEEFLIDNNLLISTLSYDIN